VRIEARDEPSKHERKASAKNNSNSKSATKEKTNAKATTKTLTTPAVS
jgi:hypothetical protein